MAVTSHILVLLNFYASRLNTAIVDYYEFMTYVKKYAQHHVEEQPDLIPFLGQSDALIDKELNNLADSGDITIFETSNKKRIIFVIPMYVRKFAKVYQDIAIKPTIPFPVFSDLPKQTPNDILNKQNASDLLCALLDKQELNDKILYCISLPHDMPSILFPSSVPVTMLIIISLAKIRNMLNKDETHEYFEKKLRMSNPGKEIAAKNFFSQFLQTPEQALKNLKESGDSFYFFSQLCFFIRKDYENIKDYTQEDLNVLQSVYIAEIVTAYYKGMLQKTQQRNTAFEALRQNLMKPQYYYSMNEILGFSDAHGVSLRGQYTDQDLKKFLEKETTESINNELPKLLVFKINTGSRYFIYKQRVFPLIVRLCTEAHDTVSQKITEKWYATLKNFEKLPEMTEQPAFERALEKEVQISSPILYALLNANFLSMLSYEQHTDNNDTHITLFANNHLLPYSELLILKRQTLLSNAKILLPFWYTIPILVWICSLFSRKKEKKQTSVESYYTKTEPESPDNKDVVRKSRGTKQVSRKDMLISAAKHLEEEYTRDGYSLDQQLSLYDKQWNKMIDSKSAENLREDVNSLIRDYTRKVLRTINSNLTSSRLQTLAEELCNTSSMKRIGEHDALLSYVKLYMIRLIKKIA
jgi:hypothetical protein